MKKASLLFLLDGDQILLAMKKRGFGKGWWNGVGGKPDPGETITETAIRECTEEIHVSPKDIKEVATLNFYFPESKKDWNQQVIAFTCTSWEGEPSETEEMSPKWFKQNELPYDHMWDDDKFWVPLMLEGKYVKADFYFDENNKLVKQTVNAI